MKIIKDKAIVEDDWQYLPDAEAPLPVGDVIIPFAYWLEHRSDLSSHNGKIAIVIDGDVETEDLTEYLEQFELIALQFPAFADGRCYSHARLLRDRYQYQGELRAVGDVLQDQLFYMMRCGIDSFALREDKDFAAALAAFDEFTVSYQTAADGQLPIYRRR